MSDQPLHIAVIIVAYNSRKDLAACLAGMDRWARSDIDVRVVVVDCDSQDGSAQYVRELFPEVAVIDAGENLGFAGGNNLGFEYVCQMRPTATYVALLNPDTVPEPGWIDPLIDHLETNTRTATCQPLITLIDRPGIINTAGNAAHYLGFGLITRFGGPIPDDLTPQQIGYSSGAAMLARADLLARFGLFEPEMFLYCEDTDLGWKLRQLGYRHDLVPGSRVAHRFSPTTAIHRHYYYLERNRWWLMLVYYKTPTLLLLLPAILLMEVGQLLYAASRGRLADKLHALGYFLKPDTRRHMLGLRVIAQDRRSVSDRAFVRSHVGGIDHPGLGGPLLRYIGNPLLSAYWWVIRRLLFW